MERRDPPPTAPERESLVGWLDFHRATLASKCAGLTPDELCRRSVPPSSLSLIGLVRHMAEVERGWFQRFMGGADGATAGPLYYTDDRPDGDFDDVDPATVDADLATWRQECDRSDEVFAGCGLDDRRNHERRGEMSVRWVMIHMVEEYARHNGHADLLRECIDGATGD